MGRLRYKDKSLRVGRSLDAALTSQQAGRLDETESISRRILEVHPDHPQALFLLAVAIGAQGQTQESVELLKRSIAIAPLTAAYHGQLGNVLAAQSKHQEALESFQRAREIEPNDPNTYNGLGSALKALGRSAEAVQQFRKGLALPGRHPGLLMNLAIVLHELGEVEEAVATYRRVIALQPDAVDAIQNLAHILKQQGHLTEALDLYERLLELRPELAIPHLNLGIALQNEDKLEEACRCYRKVIAIQPDMAAAYNNVGSALRLQGKFSEAVEYLEKAIELDAKLPIANNNLGVALQGQKKYADARAAFERAMAIDPADPEAYNNLGNLSNAEEKFDEAIEWFAKAQALQPDCAEVHNNLANVLREQGRLAEASENYRRAVDLKPFFPDAWSNMGNALREQGLFPEAIAAYAQAIDQKPDNAGFRWNKSLAELTCGDLDHGWEAYESGFGCKQRQPMRPFKQARWEGQSLTGKTILTWGEQGVGDEILFANCIPDLAEAADNCIVECDARLVPLFARSFPECEVIPRSTPPQPRTGWPDIDLHSPMGTLPRYFRPAIDRFPPQGGYLRPDPARVAYWKERLAGLGPGLKVGVSWRSRLMMASRKKHYITLEQWDPILTAPGVCFVNLQYCDYAEDIAEAVKRLGVTIHQFEDLNLRDSLDDVAALTAALDLVITIGNVNLALAGAVNTETWCFSVRHSMTWTGLGTGSTPWFPSVRVLFREWNESWTESIREAAGMLRQRA